MSDVPPAASEANLHEITREEDENKYDDEVESDGEASTLAESVVELSIAQKFDEEAQEVFQPANAQTAPAPAPAADDANASTSIVLAAPFGTSLVSASSSSSTAVALPGAVGSGAANPAGNFSSRIQNSEFGPYVNASLEEVIDSGFDYNQMPTKLMNVSEYNFAVGFRDLRNRFSSIVRQPTPAWVIPQDLRPQSRFGKYKAPTLRKKARSAVTNMNNLIEEIEEKLQQLEDARNDACMYLTAAHLREHKDNKKQRAKRAREEFEAKQRAEKEAFEKSFKK